MLDIHCVRYVSMIVCQIFHLTWPSKQSEWSADKLIQTLHYCDNVRSITDSHRNVGHPSSTIMEAPLCLTPCPSDRKARWSIVSIECCLNIFIRLPREQSYLCNRIRSSSRFVAGKYFYFRRTWKISRQSDHRKFVAYTASNETRSLSSQFSYTARYIERSICASCGAYETPGIVITKNRVELTRG